MNINPLENAKHLGKFLNTNLFVPKDIKVYSAEPGDKYFSLKEHNLIAKNVKSVYMNGDVTKIAKQNNDFCIPFAGLNSKLFYVDVGADIEELQKISKEIKENMDKRETDLVLKAKKKFKNKQLIFVRRKISPEIAKLMGATGNDIQRAIIVHPSPITKEGDESGQLYTGIYSYESIIVATVE